MSVLPHLARDTIVSYEAGALSGGWALAVACHLAMCPQCRIEAQAARALGGVMVEDLGAADVDEDALARVLEAAVRGGPELRTPFEAAPGPIPGPLQPYVGAAIDAMAWRRLGLTAQQVWIETGDRSTRARLLRVRAGQAMPVHGHGGAEMTLALVGSVHTSDGVLRPGDIEEADETTVHQPVAGPESECICLAVTGAPLRFKSRLMRIAQPFLRV